MDRALEKVARQGGEVVLIDGTLIATQRRTGKADRRNYSGKHHHHGLHFLALSDERGRLIWISTARPHPRQHRRPPGARPGPPARRGLRALADLASAAWTTTYSPMSSSPASTPAAPTSSPWPEDRHPRPRHRTRTGRTRFRPPQQLAVARVRPHPAAGAPVRCATASGTMSSAPESFGTPRVSVGP
ncbi:transposase family protein [Streptomyces nogalater]